MSFKRVADDFDDFKLQKKRRVNDLLLDAVPDEEVFLMKNGKLACLLCNHRPVFDTTAVLSIHRSSKKHLASARVKLDRAREDAEIIQKREQESYLKTNSETQAPLLGMTKRKKELALSNSSYPTNNSVQNLPSTTKGSFFKAKTNTNIKDFLKKNNKIQTNTSKDTSRRNSPQDLKRTSAKRQQFLSVNPLTKQKISEPIFETSQQIPKDIHGPCPGNDQQANLSSATWNASTSSSVLQTYKTSAFEMLDKKSRAQYLAKLRQMGWSLGTDSKWQKDVDAEFDSDDEEPPSPNSVLH